MPSLVERLLDPISAATFAIFVALMSWEAIASARALLTVRVRCERAKNRGPDRTLEHPGKPVRAARWRRRLLRERVAVYTVARRPNEEERSMAAINYLPDVLATAEAERLATGFVFTEGPLWHPDGHYFFVDIRTNSLYRLRPGGAAELVTKTIGGNGTTFDSQGRLVICEGEGRRVSRLNAAGALEPVVERFRGRRFNRPNDIICRSDGSLYFTDPDKRIPYREREIPPPDSRDGVWDGACVYRITAQGELSVVAYCEYPNGLAFSPDERTLYVANTRSSKYIHAIDLDASGKMVARRIFVDMNTGTEPGVPDGLKVDSLGRVYCTGPGGIWVLTPHGERIGTIKFPEQAVNFTFGGADLRTLFCCAHTSVYSLRVKVPGNPHPWYRARSA